MQSDFYTHSLYPLQDRVLRALKGQTSFYLTGDTAVSRFLYGHRFSDDLDFFVNRADDFQSQVDKVIDVLTGEFENVETGTAFEAFARVFVKQEGVELKVEMINDVGYHHGDFLAVDVYHRIDNPRNILSNKLSALGRHAAKDVSDIIAICGHLDFRWDDVFIEAQKKDTWVNELSAVEVLGKWEASDVVTGVNWVNPPSVEDVRLKLDTIAKDIFRGGKNTLFSP